MKLLPADTVRVEPDRQQIFSPSFHFPFSDFLTVALSLQNGAGFNITFNPTHRDFIGLID